MNIPSLSGRVLAFELSSQNVAGWRSGKRASGHDKSKKRARDAEHSSSSNIHIERTTTPLVSNLRHDGEGQRQTATAADSSLFDSIHLQQAQYLVQQEMSQNYVSLLWQELQRQLNVLFLQQGHSSLQTPQSQPQTHSRHRHHHHHHHNRHNNHIDQQTQQPASLAIADVAALLHQQQLQQQIAAANLYQVLTEPGRPANQQTILQELAEIHQQQLSNLTYQIVALVAANMDMENQNQQPQAPQPPLIQKILVKYLIALALLQLQQQQQNLEALRQERQAALAVVQSLDNATTGLAATTATATTSSTTASNVNTDVDTRRATVQQEEGRQLHNVSVTQMQQLLSDAAMLSLSRVHQLLLEAAVLVQPFSVAPTVAFEQPSPPAQPNISTPVEPTFPGTGLRLNLNGVSTQAPRATTAR